MEEERDRANVIEAAGGLLWRDSPRGKELAVIHRKDRDDWTFPKGKLKEGERWQDAALREVKEETGFVARLDSFAGSNTYTVERFPKVVLFWNMVVEGECDFQPNDEVDQLLWLPVQEAIKKLTYPGERDLITDRNRRKETGERRKKEEKQASLWSRIMAARYFVSARHRRLAETLGPYHVQLDHFVKGSTSLWAKTARRLAGEAQDALEKGDIELGWRYLSSAKLMEIYCLKGDDLKMRAKALLNEADQKEISSWRKKTIKDVLQEGGELKPKLQAAEVYYASKILQEHFDNEYHKLRTIVRQLIILQIVAFAFVIAFHLLLFITPFPDVQKVQFSSVLLVTIFGVMGAAFSGTLSIARGSTKARIPEQLFSSWVTLARPIIGAVAALAVFAFLISGLLQVGQMTPGLILAMSFAAGFSERLVMRAVETVT